MMSKYSELSEEQKQARREISQRWYARNRERARATAAAYRAENRDLLLQKQRAWWQENAEEQRARNRARYQETRDQQRAQQRDYRERNRERILTRRRELYGLLKAEVHSHYGGRCACCGETEPGFLTIDHVNGDGSAHRKLVGGAGEATLRDIQHRGYPSDFQVLCFNCNCGRQFNGGTCPHQASAHE